MHNEKLLELEKWLREELPAFTNKMRVGSDDKVYEAFMTAGGKIVAQLAENYSVIHGGEISRERCFRILTAVGFYLAVLYATGSPEGNGLLRNAEEFAKLLGDRIDYYPRLTVHGYLDQNPSNGEPLITFTGDPQEVAFIRRNTTGMLIFENVAKILQTVFDMGASHPSTAPMIQLAAQNLWQVESEVAALQDEMNGEFFRDVLRGFLNSHPICGIKQPGMDAGDGAGAKLIDLLLFGRELPDTYLSKYIQSKMRCMRLLEREQIRRFLNGPGMVPGLMIQFGLSGMDPANGYAELQRVNSLDTASALVDVVSAHAAWSARHNDVIRFFLEPDEPAAESHPGSAIHRVSGSVGTGGLDSPLRFLGELHEARSNNASVRLLREMIAVGGAAE